MTLQSDAVSLCALSGCDLCATASSLATMTGDVVVCDCERVWEPRQRPSGVVDVATPKPQRRETAEAPRRGPKLVYVAPDEAPTVNRSPLERAGVEARSLAVVDPELVRVRRLLADLRLDDQTLRALVLALGPLAELDSIAGLRARSRDQREHPGTGGEQRDAAAALDAASERGALTAARSVWAHYCRLAPDTQATAYWLAQRAGAVRGGALVGVAEWAEVYARLDGPRALGERAERLAELASAADVRLRAAKRRVMSGRTEDGARELDDARSADGQLRQRVEAIRAELRAWGEQRFMALAAEWEAT